MLVNVAGTQKFFERSLLGYYRKVDEVGVVQCTSCKTDFPIIDGRPKCNGEFIKDCPFCKRGAL
jgi:hypothetical protein